MSNNFRDMLPSADHPRLAGINHLGAYEYAQQIFARRPMARELFDGWRRLYQQPFMGITTDGHVQPDLFHLADEGAPTAAMADAANQLLAEASPEQRALLLHPVDAREWRGWSNPELYVNKLGLRLDEAPQGLRDAILRVLNASLSAKGFQKARSVMKMNQFLGQLVNAPRVLNEYSYNFNLFGTPSATEPWGWNLYGHHLVLNCFVMDRQMVISPAFFGAEPNTIDAGPDAGLTLFRDEERIGLDLMRALPAGVQKVAHLYRHMHDPAMPQGRWQPADQRHLGGRFRTTGSYPMRARARPTFPNAGGANCSISSRPISTSCRPDRSPHVWTRSAPTWTTPASAGSAGSATRTPSTTAYRARW